MVIPVLPPAGTSFQGRAPNVNVINAVLPVGTPTGAPLEVATPAGAPLEVATPAGAPLEVATPSGAPLEVSAPAGAPLEVATPAGAPLEVASLDHMNGLATIQGCGYPYVHVENIPMMQSQSGWTDMGDSGYFDPPASPPAAWCPVCLTLSNPQTCPYLFDFHVTIHDVVNAVIISEFFNYFTVQPGHSVIKFFNVPQFPDSADCLVRYILKWIPTGTPGTDQYFSMAVFATLRPNND